MNIYNIIQVLHINNIRCICKLSTCFEPRILNFNLPSTKGIVPWLKINK